MITHNIEKLFLFFCKTGELELAKNIITNPLFYHLIDIDFAFCVACEKGQLNIANG